MTREEAERVVRSAVESHIAQERGLVTAPDKLIGRILDGLGYATTLERSGWRIERVAGKDIPGTKPRYKKFTGWKLTDLVDAEVRWLPPCDSNGDVSQYWVEKFADLYREEKDAKKGDDSEPPA